jgi:hypothetical protein
MNISCQWPALTQELFACVKNRNQMLPRWYNWLSLTHKELDLMRSLEAVLDCELIESELL